MPSEPRRPPLAILIAVTAVGPSALNIFLPSMPGLQRAFNTDFATVQLTLTLYLIGLAVAQLFHGPLSDRFGRRPVLLWGLVLFLLGTLACMLAPSIWALIAARVVQAVGGCAGVVLGRAMVRDMYDRDRAASMIAYITMAMVVSPMVAPFVGGFLDEWFGWRAGFALLLMLAGPVLAAAVWCLHETHHDRSHMRGFADLVAGTGRLLGRRAFHGYAFHLSFNTAVFLAFIGGAPYVMVELMGRPPSEYGLYFMLSAVSYMAGNFTAGRISVGVGIDRMIFNGMIVVMAGATLLGVLATFWTLTPLMLFGPVAIIAFGQGLSIPTATAGAISVDPRHAGAASGASGFMQMIVGAAVSYLVGALLAETAMPLVIIMISCAVLAAAAFLVGVGVPRRAAM
jgi:MFS transporter, DHA1 family, multidrug resistance protein